jgi:hypothetical protein
VGCGMAMQKSIAPTEASTPTTARAPAPVPASPTCPQGFYPSARHYFIFWLVALSMNICMGSVYRLLAAASQVGAKRAAGPRGRGAAGPPPHALVSKSSSPLPKGCQKAFVLRPLTASATHHALALPRTWWRPRALAAWWVARCWPAAGQRHALVAFWRAACRGLKPALAP